MAETEAMVVTGVLVVSGAMEETAAMAVEIEAMVVGKEAMEVVRDPMVVVVDTPTGVEDTPAAVATGITGEGSLTFGMVMHMEEYSYPCNREPLKYGKYYC